MEKENYEKQEFTKVNARRTKKGRPFMFSVSFFSPFSGSSFIFAL